MPNFDQSSEKLRQAGEVFAGWLRERAEKNFEILCTLHPDLRTELQAFNSVLQLGQTAAASRTFHETLREQFGDAAEVTVQLEEGDFGPASSGTAGESSEGGSNRQASHFW